MNQTLENLRVSYQASKLDIEDCHQDPVIQFDKWLEEAILSKCDEPNAFVLSTVRDGQPRSRVMLLKGVHENDFVFYTNYKSAKGKEISLNDKVALTFLWLPLQRQIRIEGSVTKVTSEASDNYFHKRPRGSQIGAIASPQSEKVTGRKQLEKMFQEVEEKFKSTEVLPRPESWGGYMVTPTFLEFWQGRANRMHDRICYEKKGSNWELYRLAP
ncbi:MAG: pyridoxamine 5'-phosphate oxidase [Bacteriovoracia bacterium]